MTRTEKNAMRDFNFRWAVLLIWALNYYSAGVQIKFNFFAERKHSAIPLSAR